MTIYPKRFVFGIWISQPRLAAFKIILSENNIDYFECRSPNERQQTLFQLWLPFDPSLVLDMSDFK